MIVPSEYICTADGCPSGGRAEFNLRRVACSHGIARLRCAFRAFDHKRGLKTLLAVNSADTPQLVSSAIIASALDIIAPGTAGAPSVPSSPSARTLDSYSRTALLVGVASVAAVRSLVMDIAAVACTRLTRALSIPLLTGGCAGSDSAHGMPSA